MVEPNIFKRIGIDDFLSKNRFMVIKPYSGNNICLQGRFHFKAKPKNKIEIEDSYELQIEIPPSFPHSLPVIKELKNEITKELAHDHINPDNSLCFGNPNRLKQILNKNPAINDYVEECVVPYLYAISFRKQFGGNLIFGELSHGVRGLLEDYLELYEQQKLEKAITLIGKKKRVANKKACPCGCGERLGLCPLHYKINDLRMMKFYRTP